MVRTALVSQVLASKVVSSRVIPPHKMSLQLGRLLPLRLIEKSKGSQRLKSFRSHHSNPVVLHPVTLEGGVEYEAFHRLEHNVRGNQIKNFFQLALDMDARNVLN